MNDQFKYLPKNSILTHAGDYGHYLIQCDCLNERHSIRIHAYIDEDDVKLSGISLTIPIGKAYGIRFRLIEAFLYLFGKPIPHGMGDTILLTQTPHHAESLDKILNILHAFQAEVKSKSDGNIPETHEDDTTYYVNIDQKVDKIPKKKSNLKKNIESLRRTVSSYLYRLPDQKYDWMSDIIDRIARIIKPTWKICFKYTMYRFEPIKNRGSKHSFNYDKEFVITQEDSLEEGFFDVSFSWQYATRFRFFHRAWKVLRYSFGHSFSNLHYQNLEFNYFQLNQLIEVLTNIKRKSEEKRLELTARLEKQSYDIRRETERN